jgi:energy-coupling factor transporter ATP-binding protein EcfA2
MAESGARPSNPFPGLRPFRTEEDYLFFGREKQTAELLTLLRKHRFLAVVGTSGSGKSSLVRAGLLPELQGGTMTQAGSVWEIALMRPGGTPLVNLAQALGEAGLY